MLLVILYSGVSDDSLFSGSRPKGHKRTPVKVSFGLKATPKVSTVGSPSGEVGVPPETPQNAPRDRPKEVRVLSREESGSRKPRWGRSDVPTTFASVPVPTFGDVLNTEVGLQSPDPLLP